MIDFIAGYVWGAVLGWVLRMAYVQAKAADRLEALRGRRK